MATIGRLLKLIGLCYRISSLLQGSFAKETYDFKELTNRSHAILNFISTYNVLMKLSMAWLRLVTYETYEIEYGVEKPHILYICVNKIINL